MCSSDLSGNTGERPGADDREEPCGADGGRYPVKQHAECENHIFRKIEKNKLLGNVSAAARAAGTFSKSKEFRKNWSRVLKIYGSIMLFIKANRPL